MSLYRLAARHFADPNPGGGTVINPPSAGANNTRLGRVSMVELERSTGLSAFTDINSPDYYVDPTGGNDNNAGTSSGAAWQTMAKARDATTGVGCRIGYLSGNMAQVNFHGGVGSGGNWADRMNTHYVLPGESVSISQNVNNPAVWLKGARYLQFSGFDFEQLGNTSDKIDWHMGIHCDDFEEIGQTHHIIIEGCTSWNWGQCLGGQGATFIKVLNCLTYDGAWWHDGGGSNYSYTRHHTYPSNGDMTPVGQIDGKDIDMWFQNNVAVNARQKTDSSAIANGAGKTTDANGFILGDLYSTSRTTRAAYINCVAVGNGGKGFNLYNGVSECWYINCLAVGNGKHIVFTQDSGDPVYGMDPLGQAEFLVQAYADGPHLTQHWWNCVAVTPQWHSYAFRVFGSNMSIDAQKNWYWYGGATWSDLDDPYTAGTGYTHVPDSYSQVVGSDPLFGSLTLDETTLDFRLYPSSPLLNRGDPRLLGRAGVNTDFSGNEIDTTAEVGAAGPLSVAVL